jgi:ketosteroid isomerase-like protein
MNIDLPPIVKDYINASNAHDVKSILACFTDDAEVRDENATMHGKIDIERWATETIEKYKFHFRPLGTEGHDCESIVRVEISGTFPGSPISLDYHFVLAKDKIASLIIDS